MSDTRRTVSMTKVVGLIFILFGALDIVFSAIGFIAPDVSGLYDSTMPIGVVNASSVAVIAFGAVEMILGFIAWRGRLTKVAAVICLIIAVFFIAGFLGNFLSGTDSFVHGLRDGLNAIVPLIYCCVYRISSRRQP